MNKKLVLSVLSTAVVASMASSAMAKPAAGIYIGGQVDKYYGAVAFLDNIDTALDEVLDNLSVSVFVDGEGNAAPMLEALTADDINDVLEPAQRDLFEENDYAIVGGEGAWHPEDEDDWVTGELAVESVSAINATQVEIEFNKAVDPDTLFDNGEEGAFVANTVIFKSIETTPVEPGDLSGELSEDGKTLTVTAENPLSKRYNVVIQNLKAVDGTEITKYDEIVTFAADTTAPTIVSTVKNSASTYTVTFSEPIKAIGNVTYKYADGSAVPSNAVTHDFSTTTDKVTFTLGQEIGAGKTVVATIIGAQDTASNLLTPNPATVSFVKGALDGVAPTVGAITQTGANSFTVKFSEELAGKPTITVNGTAVDGANVVKDSTDPTVYKVTVDNVLDGATTVTISSFTDLSGEVGKDSSKVVVFVKDADAPKVTSSKVAVDATTSKEYLEITFDKDVTLADAGATVDGEGSYIKNFVTTTVDADDLGATPIDFKNESNKKVVRVELDAFLGTTDVEGATYTLELTFVGVTSAAGVEVDASEVTFTRGKDGVPASDHVVTVEGIAQDPDDNNKVVFTFDKAVDGASATNKANYRIDGAVVKSVTLLPVDDDGKQVAVVTLEAGSNQFTGERNVYVSGIKALGSSKTMEQHQEVVPLNENVAPVITSAELVSTTEIALTFSEAVIGGVSADFEVLIGGKSQAEAEEVNVELTAASTTATVTIAEIDADELSKGISLKALSSLDITDEVGNKLSVPANVTVSN